jgi:1-acyl-sn-glycerol-3-phosphate acyltransferase
MKILAYPLSVVYYFLFFLCLGVFHPLQWLGLKIGGYKGHKLAVDAMNFCLVQCLRVLGTSFSISGVENLPADTPLAIVSNHQSMYDISPLSWYLRKHHPKFISKIELGKGIPSVSFNLRHGGSVLIDRKDSKQSLRAILGFGKFIEKNNYSAVIFPEGTRSKTGEPRTFKTNGIKMLVKSAPSALMVPVTINNSWKLQKNGMFPITVGVKFKLHVHKPIDPKAMDFESLVEKIEKTVTKDVTY